MSSDYIRKINEVEVDPQMLVDIVSARARQSSPDREDVDRRLLVAIDLLRANYPKANNIPFLALAIDLRLRALARLLARFSSTGDTLDENAMILAAAPAVLSFAARTPMSCGTDGLAAFDMAEFQTQCLH